MLSLFLAVVSVGCAAPTEMQTNVGLFDGRLLPGASILSTGCSGSPHNTIQSAIDAAQTGDIVEVCPGTYNEHLRIIGKKITLRSRDGADVTTIDAQWLGRGLEISNGADVTVAGFTFVNGSIIGAGGNVYCVGSELDLRDSVIAAGSADKGGGLGASDCVGIVEDSTFEANSSIARAGGAWISGDLFHVERNTFVENTSLGKGGGLYIDGSANVIGNTFDGNHSDMDGGAAYIRFTFGDLVENTVINNTAEDDGGGIYVYEGGPMVLCNTFDANEAEGEGGGLRIKLSEAVIEDNVFTSNHADYRGGAMRVSHEEVTMTGNVYVGNSTWGVGGAVLLFESASLVTDEIYQENEGDDGGALAIIEGWGGVTIQDTTFIDNEGELGGHIYVNLFGETTTLRRVDLIGGEAEQGGAVWAVTSILEFENTLFDGNVADLSGGAMWLDACTGVIVNSVVHQNEAPEGAGLTVVNGTGVGLEVSNTIFHENTTGAAVALVYGWMPVIRYNAFWGNTLDFSGMFNLIGSFGNLAVSPGFVDAANGDFHLGANSPVIDLGSPLLSDLDGSRSDMGMYGGPNAP